jgi:hypothetical protein
MKKLQEDVSWAVVTDESLFNYYAKEPALVNKPKFLIMRRGDRAPLLEFGVEAAEEYSKDNFESQINRAKIERHRVRSAEPIEHTQLHEARSIARHEVRNREQC